MLSALSQKNERSGIRGDLSTGFIGSPECMVTVAEVMIEWAATGPG
jgi:hypothetical protein